MITELNGSSGKNIGFAVSGEVTKADYDVLTPLVEGVVAAHGSINMLCDMRDFTWEKVSAWGSDLHFGHEFKDKTDKMAVVGDSGFDHFVAELAKPFYAKQVKYFTDTDEAWAWLRSEDAS